MTWPPAFQRAYIEVILNPLIKRNLNRLRARLRDNKVGRLREHTIGPTRKGLFR